MDISFVDTDWPQSSIVFMFSIKGYIAERCEKLGCNLKEELEQELQACSAENRRLIEQINCEVSKCSITVYRECINLPSCGSVNGINCAYLPDGIGDSQCATSACPAVQGKVVDFKTI